MYQLCSTKIHIININPQETNQSRLESPRKSSSRSPALFRDDMKRHRSEKYNFSVGSPKLTANCGIVIIPAASVHYK